MTIQKSGILIKKSGNDEIWIYPVTTSDNILHNNEQLDDLIVAIQSAISSLDTSVVKASQVTDSLEITESGYVGDARSIHGLSDRVAAIEAQGNVTSDINRRIHVSTVDPTIEDGNDGDIWIVYTPEG